MHNNFEDSSKRRTRPLVHLLGTMLARSFGNILGSSIKLIFCHKMSSNVYIFLLQSLVYITEYLNYGLSEVKHIMVLNQDSTDTLDCYKK